MARTADRRKLPVGFEPTAPGLQSRCSGLTELRKHACWTPWQASSGCFSRACDDTHFFGCPSRCFQLRPSREAVWSHTRPRFRLRRWRLRRARALLSEAGLWYRSSVVSVLIRFLCPSWFAGHSGHLRSCFGQQKGRPSGRPVKSILKVCDRLALAASRLTGRARILMLLLVFEQRILLAIAPVAESHGCRESCHLVANDSAPVRGAPELFSKFLQEVKSRVSERAF